MILLRVVLLLQYSLLRSSCPNFAARLPRPVACCFTSEAKYISHIRLDPMGPQNTNHHTSTAPPSNTWANARLSPKISFSAKIRLTRSVRLSCRLRRRWKVPSCLGTVFKRRPVQRFSLGRAPGDLHTWLIVSPPLPWMNSYMCMNGKHANARIPVLRLSSRPVAVDCEEFHSPILLESPAIVVNLVLTDTLVNTLPHRRCIHPAKRPCHFVQGSILGTPQAAHYSALHSH